MATVESSPGEAIFAYFFVERRKCCGSGRLQPEAGTLRQKRVGSTLQ